MTITLKDYLTASGSYPERETHKELTQDYLNNAQELLTAVNSFLDEIKWTGSRKVSSGFRPSEVNAATSGAAKKSLHMTCEAVDIIDDKSQTLSKLCEAHPKELKKYALFLEDPTSTKGKNTNWCHLDMSKTRPDRPSRKFKP